MCPPCPHPAGDPGGGAQDPRSRSRLPAAGAIVCWDSAPRPPPADGVSGGSVGRLPGGSEKQLGPQGQAGAEEGEAHQGLLWREAGGGPGRTNPGCHQSAVRIAPGVKHPGLQSPAPGHSLCSGGQRPRLPASRVLTASPHVTARSPTATGSSLFKGQGRAGRVSWTQNEPQRPGCSTCGSGRQTAWCLFSTPEWSPPLASLSLSLFLPRACGRQSRHRSETCKATWGRRLVPTAREPSVTCPSLPTRRSRQPQGSLWATQGPPQTSPQTCSSQNLEALATSRRRSQRGAK